MKRHAKLVPQVRCPECDRTMYHLNTTDSQTVYGCTQGHIHKVPRTNILRPSFDRYQPPNDAA
jgi:hypothetical protein